jgi:hypothetical protein
VGGVVIEKPLPVGRQPEEIRFLGDEGRLLAAIRAGLAVLAVERRVLGQKILVRDAVPAPVFALVDVARVDEFLEELLDAALVEFHGRADEEVVGDVERLPKVQGPGDDGVGQGLGRQALLGRRLLDLLAVLVGPRQEKDLPAGLLVKPGQSIGDDRRVGVPDVGNVVDVIDRRRDVEGPVRIP